ncbi:hypothetical protein NY10_665 [Carnobacterium antarcticum]|nr:hypothetical protein NY10_665 [Carnobacterium sp. CP1]
MMAYLHYRKINRFRQIDFNEIEPIEYLTSLFAKNKKQGFSF